MSDAIAWSYDLLPPGTQQLLRHLAIFVGGFDVEGAAAIANADPNAMLDDLQLLIDQSLLQRAEPTNAGEEATPRFLMLETIREFGLERLAEHDEQADAEAKHAAYVLALAEAAEPHLLGPDERRWSDRLGAELGNVRAALAWAIAHQPEMALRIGAALWVLLGLRVHVTEGRHWLERALAAGEAEDAYFRSRTMAAAALLATFPGDVAASVELARGAVALARKSENRLAEAFALSHESAAAFFTGEPDRAAALIDQSLKLFEGVSDSTYRAWVALVRAYRGLAAAMLGETERAIHLYEEALAEAREARSDRILLFVLDDFAGLLIDLGQIVPARVLLAEALEVAAGVDDTHPLTLLLVMLAAADAAEGKAELAARRLGAVEATYRQAGISMPIPQQRRADRAREQATQALGSEAFAAEREAGRATPAEVIAAAFAEQASGTVLTPLTDPARVLGLTPRERGVLRLVVEGRTDREIAEQLFISRKTASNHVSNILSKLAVDTRSAAVARAVRDGLT